MALDVSLVTLVDTLLLSPKNNSNEFQELADNCQPKVLLRSVPVFEPRFTLSWCFQIVTKWSDFWGLETFQRKLKSIDQKQTAIGKAQALTFLGSLRVGK